VTNGASVQVVGDTRLALTLHAAADALSHLERAGQAAGRLVETRARGAAPKRTGRLASSLRAEVDGDTARVRSDLVYAGVIHYGWAARNIRAHPFLVPVAAASEPVWRTFYVAEVRTVLGHVKGM
jgi:phage gpG-like protein